MEGLGIALLGGAISVFLAGIGSAIGIGIAGQVANGVLGEKPEKFGEMFLLVALPGTQGIYGFAVGIWLLIKLGILGGNVIYPTISQGWNLLFACLPVAFAGLISGIHQGKVCGAGIGVVAKQEGQFIKAVMYGVLVETYALLGFVASILILIGIKL